MLILNTRSFQKNMLMLFNYDVSRFKADLHSANLSRGTLLANVFFPISIWGERNVLFT